MAELNFKKSYFTIMILCFTVLCVFLVFGYFATNGFAQNSYPQATDENQQTGCVWHNLENSVD